MQFARVIGTLVATQKVEGLEGVKFLVVQPLDKHQQPMGEPAFVIYSREAALALPEWFVPVDLAIVGIVDEADVS